jgi:hypothetical protein
MLDALYYPFSRCIDSCALKQLLLVFDSVTFLDPVEDDAWRAKLFRDLEIAEDPRFRSYRHLEQPLTDLRREGVISLRNPRELAAFDLPETSAGAISDLQDPVWCGIAGNPKSFGLPHRALDERGRPTWQIFESKFPPPFRRVLDEQAPLRWHIVRKGDRLASWTVSYEAGSAATLNLHLAAAHELSLAPVTDSTLHHRLLLRKLTRSLTPDAEWQQPASESLDLIINRTAMQFIEELLPRAALSAIRFDSIVRFRENTRVARVAMMQQLRQKLAPIASLSVLSDIAAAQASVIESLSRELQTYRAELAATRQKMWPDLIHATGTAVTTGTAAAVALQYLVGGAYAVLAGSIAGAALSLLESSLTRRADATAVKRAAGPAVTYLSRVAELATEQT